MTSCSATVDAASREKPCAVPPWRHSYHQTLVSKPFVGRKPDRVDRSPEQVLQGIREVARLTRGMPHIVYLVGWQFDGHDSKYPAWSEVNPRLKRPQDPDARHSMVWLMREARQYGATVSLHLNMCDAYENSPLWEEYRRHDLLVREANGELKKGGVWGGDQSYLVNKVREWASGHAQRRIDTVLELLPLQEAGTVHLDVFQPMPSPYHGTTRQQEYEVMAKILRYWHARGVDVTTELWQHELAGLIPMVWHINWDEGSRLRYAPWEACGGGSAWNMRHIPRGTGADGFARMPEAGCLYEEAWGHSIDEDIADPGEWVRQFGLRTLVWQCLNAQRPVEHVHTAERYEVRFNGGTVSSVRKADRHLTIRDGERVWVDGGDVLAPLAWREDELLAYSERGGSRRWQLPGGWRDAKSMVVEPLYPQAERPYDVPVQDGEVALTLASNQLAAVRRR